MNEATDAELVREARVYDCGKRHIGGPCTACSLKNRLVDALETALAEKQAATKERDEYRFCDCGHLIADHEDGALCHHCGCTVPLFMWTIRNAKLIEENRVLREFTEHFLKHHGKNSFDWKCFDCSARADKALAADALRDKENVKR